MTLSKFQARKLVDLGAESRDVEELTRIHQNLYRPGKGERVIHFGTLFRNPHYKLVLHQTRPTASTKSEVIEVRWELSDSANNRGSVYGYINGLSANKRLYRELEGKIRLHNRIPLQRLVLALYLGTCIDAYEVHHATLNPCDNRISGLFAVKKAAHVQLHKRIDHSVVLQPLVDPPKSSYLEVVYFSNTENKRSCGSSMQDLLTITVGEQKTRRVSSICCFGLPKKLTKCITDLLAFMHQQEGNTKKSVIQSNFSPKHYATGTLEEALRYSTLARLIERKTRGVYALTQFAYC